MKFKFLVILSFINFIAFGQSTAKAIKSNLPGRWDWKHTHIVDRGGGGIVSPLTCKCNMYLVFEKGDVVKEYRNDTLISSSSYTLEEIHFMNDPVKIMFRSKFLSNEIKMSGDSIAMGSFGMCGSIISYRKVNR